MAFANADFDAILSSTISKYRTKFEDNVFTSRPLLFWLKSNDRMRKESGGATIVEPLVHALNDTAGSYAGYDSILTTPQEGLSAAEYQWKQFAATIAISGIEEAKNNGEAAVIKLLKAKIMQAEETVAEKLDEMLFLDGTGNSNKDFLGLAALVSTTGSPGGINRATTPQNDFWKSTVDSTAAVLTIAQMTSLYNTISKGNDHPDFGITTQALYEKYESLLQPQLRFTDNKSADAGFQNLLFKNIPLFFDIYCQSGVVYLLNSKYLHLVGHTDKWFSNTPFVKPHGQDARYAQILSYGELTASNCARQGKLTAKTAS